MSEVPFEFPLTLRVKLGQATVRGLFLGDFLLFSWDIYEENLTPEDILARLKVHMEDEDGIYQDPVDDYLTPGPGSEGCV